MKNEEQGLLWFPRSAWERSLDALRPETDRRCTDPDATQSVAPVGSHAERGNQEGRLPFGYSLFPVLHSSFFSPCLCGSFSYGKMP